MDKALVFKALMQALTTEVCQVWQTMLIEPSAIIKESSWCPARIMFRRLIQTNLKRDLSENLVGEGQHHVSTRSPVAQ